MDLFFSSTSSEEHSETLRETPAGTLFCASLFDLFSTLIASLRLYTHKRAFRSYPFSFTPDEALANLASLQLCRSERRASEDDPARTVVVTTTKVFTLRQGAGLQLLQSCVDAHLIRSAWDSSSPVQEGRGLYVVTPKGIAVIQRFAAENGIGTDHLLKLFEHYQSKRVDLISIPRREADDGLRPSYAELVRLFKRFAGPKYNAVGRLLSAPPDPRNGVCTQTVEAYVSEGNMVRFENCFSGSDAATWLLEHTTANSIIEACQLCARFCQIGMMEICHDGRDREDRSGEHAIRTVQPSGAYCTTTFIHHPLALYQITRKGERKAHTSPWSDPLPIQEVRQHESYNKRLQQILGDPARLAVFRDFLVTQLAAENLSLWLDVEHLRRRYNTISSATAAGPTRAKSDDSSSSSSSWKWFLGKRAAADIVEEPGTTPQSSGIDTANQGLLHHQQLSKEALDIYDKYVPVGAPREVNVAGNLRQKAAQLIDSLPTRARPPPQPAAPPPPRLGRQNSIRLRPKASDTFSVSGGTAPPPVPALSPNQLRSLVHLLLDIQEAARIVMVTDLIPRFLKSDMSKSTESIPITSAPL